MEKELKSRVFYATMYKGFLKNEKGKEFLLGRHVFSL